MAVNLIRAHREELMPGLDRQARPHGDRRGRQPVRPDPVRPARAAADGAPDRPPAAAGAARRAERPDLLLDAAPPGAPLHQPDRLARQRVRRLRRAARRAIPDPRAQAGRRDRRGRLRPDRALRGQARRRSRRFIAEQTAGRGRARAGARSSSTARSPSCACSSATCCSCRRARAAVAAGVPAATSCAQVWSQALVLGGAPRRRRRRPRQALSARRPRPGDERPAQGLAGVPQEVPDAAAAADEAT